MTSEPVESPIRLAWMGTLLSTPADEGLDAYARAVAFALLSHMDRAGFCRPSTRRLATMSGCSRNVVMERIARLERAGLLVVERRHRAVSGYRATLPGLPTPETSGSPDKPDMPPAGSPDEPASSAPGSPDKPDNGEDLARPVNQPDPSGSSERQSGSPGGHRTLEPSLPTTRARSTYEAHARDEPKPKITPKRIFNEMARRRLKIARDIGATWAPPAGCARRREDGWLKDQVAALVEQHGLELDALIARSHPDIADPKRPWRNDPDWYVWKLDPDLAKRDWNFPTHEQTQASLAAYRAEVEAASVSPEKLAEYHAEARRFAAELRDRRDRRHLQVVRSEAS